MESTSVSSSNWFSNKSNDDNLMRESDLSLMRESDLSDLNRSRSDLDVMSDTQSDSMSEFSMTTNDDYKVELLDKIQNLIKQYSVEEILTIIEPIYLLYNADDFFIPDAEKIRIYVKAFKKLFKYHSVIVDQLFRLHKVLPQTSANGKVWVIKLDKASPKAPKLLIKQPINIAHSDPISYEYYVGSTLNVLREYHIPNFSIVYGKLVLRNIHYVLYEYIRDKNDDTKTLYKFIKDSFRNGTSLTELEVSLSGIISLLLLSLQHSQDKLLFTHYDLHLQNILVVKLKHMYKFNYFYKGKTYILYSEYMPYIIDYGRSYVNPDTITKEDPTFVDTNSNLEFNTFKEYQDYLWSDIRMQKYSQNIETLRLHISNVLKLETIQHMVGTSDIEEILQKFYLNDSKQVLPFNPKVFNPNHDFYRFLRSLCTLLSTESSLYNIELSNIWSNLNTELGLAYPFSTPKRFELTKFYTSITGRFNSCIDIVDYLYKYISLTNVSFKDTETEVFGWEQIAGGKRSTSDLVYETISKKLRKIKKSKLTFAIQ
jgi:hypothetical protein